MTPAGTHIDDTAIAAIQAIDAASMGAALPVAKMLAELVPTLAQQVAAAMDMNHDGLLTFDESLNPNLLGPTLRPLLAPLTDALRNDMALASRTNSSQACRSPPSAATFWPSSIACRRLCQAALPSDSACGVPARA